MRRHESPLKRINPSGRTVWVARFTDSHGKRRSAGTFPTKREAQDAIDRAYDLDSAPRRPDTLGTYAETWTQRHPRSHRTNVSYNHRVGRILDVRIEGRKLRDWPLGEIRRRQINDLVEALLVEQGRAQKGAQGVLRVLSALFEDAITDEAAEMNPVRGVRVKVNDPRITKQPRKVRLWSWDEMYDFAAAAATVRTGKHEPSPTDKWRPVYAEPMIRTVADCGLRLGELLPLERRDVKGAGPCDERGCKVTVPHLHIERTAHQGAVQRGTKNDHGQAVAGRCAPLPPAVVALLAALPPRIDTRLLFPSPTGILWQESPFYRDLWWPAQKVSGMDIRPHEMRHSWVSHLRAAGFDPADLAAMAGHTVETATKHYTHALGRSYEGVAAFQRGSRIVASSEGEG